MANASKTGSDLLARARRALRRGLEGAITPASRTSGAGMEIVGREAKWVGFDIGQESGAVELSGRLEGGLPGREKTVIARVRVFDRHNRSLDHLLKGLRTSDANGKYVYPLEYVVADVFRFSLAAPPETARLELAVQHWRKDDATSYRLGPVSLSAVPAVINAPSRLGAGSGDEAREKLREAEATLRDALRQYVRRLAAAPGPLYRDEAAFAEPLAEHLIHDEGLAEAAGRLAGRRLRAGRDREALGLIGLAPGPELDKAFGQRNLHAHLARTPRAAQPSPSLKRRSLVYLMHNALPHDSGGYAARSHGLLRGYVEAGWEVLAVTRPGYPGDRGHTATASSHRIDGIDYLTLPDAAGVDGPDQTAYVQRFADQVTEIARSRDVGLVQAASFFHNGLAGRIVADRLGLPMVYEMRGMEWLTRSSNDPRWLDSDQCRLMRDLELRAAADADHVFAITGALRDWLVEQGIDAGRISLLPNGCSPDRFTPLPRDEALAAELGVTDAFVVAYIGSFAAYEGITEIVTAVGRARDLSGRDIRLLLVGDGQVAPAVDQHILKTGAADYVIRTGRVTHARIPAFYSITDALVLARRDIPLTRMISPLKPLEALAMGKPVISTGVAAVAEILEDAGVGRIVAPKAQYGLAHAIAEAAADGEALKREGEAGRAWAVANRDWRVLAHQALAELEQRFAPAGDVEPVRDVEP